jgi:hypothetical protein
MGHKTERRCEYPKTIYYLVANLTAAGNHPQPLLIKEGS